MHKAIAKPTVSIVIPTLNGGRLFKESLAAIKKQRTPLNYEIIVMDSGSTDQTLGTAEAAGARIFTTSRSKFNHGKTRNQAIQASNGDFIVLSVQDAMPLNSHWLEILLDPLLNHPHIAGNFGLQKAPPTADLLSRAKSALWASHMNSPLVTKLENSNAFWELTVEQRIKLVTFDNVTSCIRRTVWEKTPFPERLFAEDMAWAKEVLFQGHAIAFSPQAQVWHYHKRSWFYELCRAYVNGLTQVELVKRHPSPFITREREVITLLYRAIRAQRTRRLDFLTDQISISKFIETRLNWYTRSEASKPDHVFAGIMRFARILSKEVFEIAGPEIPEGVWSDILRFAIVAQIGDHLGTTITAKLNTSPLLQQVFWKTLHRSLTSRVLK